MNTVAKLVTGEMSALAEVITDYQAAEKFDTDKWSDMVTICVAAECTTKDEWVDYYEQAEEEQASKREWNGEDIKRTKAGKVVASKAFPKTWNTDKSIIGKALDLGVSLTDDHGNPKPKTALQQEYKEATPKSEKTAFEKIQTTINTLQSLYSQLETEEERENVKQQLVIILGLV